MMKATLAELNAADLPRFLAVCGPLFEHSPWIAERTWPTRPFDSLDALHQALVSTVDRAIQTEQISLIAAHPDLVGRAARAGQLTQESTREQAAAGLGKLSVDELQQFQEYNRAYREKFGFPFVICARQNKKDAILAAFPVRLVNTRDEEITTALAEIAKIGRLRLIDAVEER